MDDHPILSVVVIGRNEGMRLVRCIESVQAMDSPEGPVEIIYVDSASTDDSVERVFRLGVNVIEVNPSRPCAAVGRNAGWRIARADLVLFLDGDTILVPDFIKHTIRLFDDASIGVAFGSCRELNTKFSIYNRVLDLDWIGRSGLVEFSGGNALVRRAVLEKVGGYDERLIAAEDTEMCARIRGASYKVLCIDRSMVGHDLAMSNFSQYWRRAIRTGYAYAEVSEKIKPMDSPVWYRQARRNLLQGSVMLLIVGGALTLALVTGSFLPIIVAVAVIVALSVRTAIRSQWKGADPKTRLIHGLHSHFVQIPILAGQMKYRFDKIFGRTAKLIEYKGAGTPNPSNLSAVSSKIEPIANGRS
jgi:cellulose synthase/poly-beta-1,6-N-acetylglucosamine synthase-like glycosyltransferase